MRFVFFSMRNFERDGGGSIRMYGLLNSLAEKGNEVVFISNAKNYTNFHPKIEHVFINYEFKDKAKLQGLTSVLPAKFISLLYPKLFSKIIAPLLKANLKYDASEKLIFCEYLDNTLAYLLKKKGVIRYYINDLHGIATLEFEHQIQVEKSFFRKLIYQIKYFLTDKLDRKVFEFGDGFIYVSEAMKKYYFNAYKNLEQKKHYLIPNLLSRKVCNIEIDTDLKNMLITDFKFKPNDFIFFFAGGYKPTAGVEDLITAFAKLYTKYPQLKLLLIGTGSSLNNCKSLVEDKQLNEVVTFIEKIPYYKLKTYQSLANVIVCPDRFNLYSESIVHLKYFDALISGNLVINGTFTSVKEININDFLSLGFEPSNVESLYKTMEKCVLQYEDLCVKYQETKEYAIKNLTYESYINQLIN